MDKINSRRNNGTCGFIPRLQHKSAKKAWNIRRSWRKVFRGSK